MTASVVVGAHVPVEYSGGLIMDWLSLDEFKPDVERIAEAAEELGVTWPIHLKLTHGGCGRTRGRAGTHRTHRCIHGDPYHVITLGRYTTRDEASHTLWHELTHAMQSERDGEQALRAQRSTRYSKRPVEIEANRIADAHEHDLLTEYASLDPAHGVA